MSLFPEIRSLYRPLQPSLRPGDAVRYQEFLPAPALQPFIYCYWLLHTEAWSDETQHPPFQYRVVTDGCIDVFFDLRLPKESFVMGFCNQYTEFPLEGPFRYAGIRFLPSMFVQLFPMKASELSHRSEALEAVVPGLAQYLSNRFHPEISDHLLTEWLDHFFLQHLQRHSPTSDPRFYQAMHTILQATGQHRLGPSIDTGISPRQLRRLFEHYVGDSAKTFSKVIRFQNFLRHMDQHPQGIAPSSFLEAGYYDQAHFIKEFKTLYGNTPGQILRP